MFYVPSTARSFRDGTLIYCPLRRTWSSVSTPFQPGIEPRAVVWQSITLPLRHASSTNNQIQHISNCLIWRTLISILHFWTSIFWSTSYLKNASVLKIIQISLLYFYLVRRDHNQASLSWSLATFKSYYTSFQSEYTTLSKYLVYSKYCSHCFTSSPKCLYIV